MTENVFGEAYFDAGLDRTGTDCVKWDECRREHGEGTLPMWVADMDFPSPPSVVEAIQERAKHPTFGYTAVTDEDSAALCGYWKRRHGLEVRQQDTVMLPCVVTGMKVVIEALTEKGDGVILQPPVYGPFGFSIDATGRRRMEAPLKEKDGYYTMDLEAVEERCRQGAKLMLLCSPHNPVGRCWTRKELQDLLDVLDRYGVVLVSDEIHADFVYAPHVFTPALSLTHQNVLSLCAASKTFNLAGLQQSACLCPDERIREKIQKTIDSHGVVSGNIFALTATRAAYLHGDAWLDGLLVYLKDNVEELKRQVSLLLPEAVLTPMEATYLGWLDLRKYGLSTEELLAKCERAGVAFTGGTFFSKSLGEGFLRVNIGCPRRYIREGISRLKTALET